MRDIDNVINSDSKISNDKRVQYNREYYLHSIDIQQYEHTMRDDARRFIQLYTVIKKLKVHHIYKYLHQYQHMMSVYRHIDVPVDDSLKNLHNDYYQSLYKMYRTYDVHVDHRDIDIEYAAINTINGMMKNINSSMIRYMNSDKYDKHVILNIDSSIVKSRYNRLVDIQSYDSIHISYIVDTYRYVPPYDGVDGVDMYIDIDEDSIDISNSIVCVLCMIHDDIVHDRIVCEGGGGVDVDHYIGVFNIDVHVHRIVRVYVDKMSRHMMKYMRENRSSILNRDVWCSLIVCIYHMCIDRGDIQHVVDVRSEIFKSEIANSSRQDNNKVGRIVMDRVKDDGEVDIGKLMDRIEVCKISSIIVCMMSWNVQWVCYWQVWAKLHRKNTPFMKKDMREMSKDTSTKMMKQCVQLLQHITSVSYKIETSSYTRIEKDISHTYTYIIDISKSILSSCIGEEVDIESIQSSTHLQSTCGMIHPINTSIVYDSTCMYSMISNKTTYTRVCGLLSMNSIDTSVCRLISLYKNEYKHGVVSNRKGEFVKQMIDVCECIVSSMRSFEGDGTMYVCMMNNIMNDVMNMMYSMHIYTHDDNSIISSIVHIVVSYVYVCVSSKALSTDRYHTIICDMMGCIGRNTYMHIVNRNVYGDDDHTKREGGMDVDMNDVLYKHIDDIVDSMIDSIVVCRDKHVHIICSVLKQYGVDSHTYNKDVLETYAVGMMMQLKVIIQTNYHKDDEEFIKSYPTIDKQISRLNDALKKYNIGDSSIHDIHDVLLNKWIDNTYVWYNIVYLRATRLYRR